MLAKARQRPILPQLAMPTAWIFRFGSVIRVTQTGLLQETWGVAALQSKCEQTSRAALSVHAFKSLIDLLPLWPLTATRVRFSPANQTEYRRCRLRHPRQNKPADKPSAGFLHFARIVLREPLPKLYEDPRCVQLRR